GLAPPPRTSARVSVLCVPLRLAASWAVTTWWSTAWLGSMPNRASSRSTFPFDSPLRVRTSTLAISPPPAPVASPRSGGGPRRPGVDQLAGRGDVGLQLLAHLVGAGVVDPQLDHLLARFDPGLGEVPGLGPRQAAGLDDAEGDLERAVAVVLERLHLHDPAGS